MIVLVSGATSYPRSDQVGHLVVPRNRNRPSALCLQPHRWAMDNGAFGDAFNPGQFVAMLEAFMDQPPCLFVTAPDVISKAGVGDAAATLKRWPFWSRLLRGLGLPPALVAQDGLTPDRVPWEELGALFIGGSTVFKESDQARSLCGIAKAKGIWVHWGRVNSQRRYKLAAEAGADSIDGTGFSWWPHTNIPKVLQWEQQRQSRSAVPNVRVVDGSPSSPHELGGLPKPVVVVIAGQLTPPAGGDNLEGNVCKRIDDVVKGNSRMPRRSRPRPGAPDGWSTDDWATPPAFVAALEAEFGKFDLDPCATDQTAKADRYFTIEENGLVQPWAGLVFVNPPYSNVAPWIEKAIAEWEAGRARSLLLLPNNTDTTWFHDLVLAKCHVRFLRGRIAFLGHDGQPVVGNRGGNLLVLVSSDPLDWAMGFHL